MTHFAELDPDTLRCALHDLTATGADDGDIYLESSTSESWSLEDGLIKTGSHSHDKGVGVRAISGEKVGFAYADELTAAALSEAVFAARGIVQTNNSQPVQAWRSQQVSSLYGEENPLAAWPVAEKLSLLRRADEAARSASAKVVQVMASLSASYEHITVAAVDGTLASDIRPLVRMNVSVIVEHEGRRETGGAGAGGRGSYAQFFGGDKPESLAKEAVRLALVALEARPAPAGNMTVVLGPGWPGILLHEAVGHGLEGDFNRKGTSAFSGKIGQKVASELCTVVDDGTLPHRRGSLSIDDEGTQSQCTTLIQDGILQGYIQDKLNAKLMGVAATGNGRRESYAHLPMPRMTNTYLKAGPHNPADIISSVKKGLYAVNFGGGQVDITSGNFTFSASEAYLIEDGKITAPVKGATLIGNGPEALQRVSMLGNDLKLDDGVGVCGKNGQGVPVGVGQPTLRIDSMTVGGTA
jgi:TldD protein